LKVNFSLSFSPRSAEVLSGGSAEGRLIILMQDPLSQFSISISNPYTQRSFNLPPLTSIKRDLVFSILKGEDGADIYKVVVMGLRSDSNLNIVKIYDSSIKTWRIAGHIS
jgi:hypothetical protein